ncbi:MAG: hypothetical protein ACYTGQ_19855, partial [Planctomycetota bacterium]
MFEELYDLQTDAIELTNLAERPEHRDTVKHLSQELHAYRREIGREVARAAPAPQSQPIIPSEPPAPPRTDIHISGVYPHLTTYGVYSQNGAHYVGGHNECGIGAVVP